MTLVTLYWFVIFFSILRIPEVAELGVLVWGTLTEPDAFQDFITILKQFQEYEIFNFIHANQPIEFVQKKAEI